MGLIITCWAAFTFLIAAIAVSKGRYAIVWLILGGLFGIFALIAVCAMPRIDRSA